MARYDYVGSHLAEEYKTPATVIGIRKKQFVCKTCEVKFMGQPGRKYCDDCSPTIKRIGRS